MKRGVTLVEVLVSIGIISILLGISAPALRSSAQRARSVVCLATIRSLGQATHVYTNDHGHWPYAAVEPRLDDALLNPLRPDPMLYWWQVNHWMLAMHGYLDGEEFLNPAAHDPWSPIVDRMADPEVRAILPEGSVFPSNYNLSTALFSGAALWLRENPVADESQLARVQAAAVAYPSQKVMYHEVMPHHLGAAAISDLHAGILKVYELNIVYVDGSARAILSSDRPASVPNPMARPGEGFAGPLTNTWDGYLGRDF